MELVQNVQVLQDSSLAGEGQTEKGEGGGGVSGEVNSVGGSGLNLFVTVAGGSPLGRPTRRRDLCTY